jgi:arginyl-tRNA--protein-N-Asp/Glu arginylyltransferase
MAGKKKTFCKEGHRLSGKNVYRRKNGSRECRECSRVRAAAQKSVSA